MTSSNSVNISDEGLQVFDSSAGTFSAVDLTTKGDILGYSTDYTRVGVGTDTFALSADSTQASGLAYKAVSAGSTDRVLISSQDASSSTSISFTSVDNSTYTGFQLIWRDVHPQTDNVTLEALLSINTGSSYLSSNYYWMRSRLIASGTSVTQTNNASDSQIDIIGNIGSAAGEGSSGELYLYPVDVPGTDYINALDWKVWGVNNSGVLIFSYGAGYNDTTTTVDAIRLQFSSGNIVSGNFSLFGYLA